MQAHFSHIAPKQRLHSAAQLGRERFAWAKGARFCRDLAGRRGDLGGGPHAAKVLDGA